MGFSKTQPWHTKLANAVNIGYKAYDSMRV